MRVVQAAEFGGAEVLVPGKHRSRQPGPGRWWRNTSTAPRWVTGDRPADEPFLQLINGGQPFAAVPYSVHLNDIASLFGEQGSSQSIRRRYDGDIS
jgi:hypothetical protein